MGRHPRTVRAASASKPGPDTPTLDLGETIGQRIIRELREKLGPSNVRPCGCCGTKTGPPREGAAMRPCGCTTALCQEDGCYKCLRHCPHRKPPARRFEKPEDVIAHIRGRSSR